MNAQIDIIIEKNDSHYVVMGLEINAVFETYKEALSFAKGLEHGFVAAKTLQWDYDISIRENGFIPYEDIKIEDIEFK